MRIDRNDPIILDYGIHRFDIITDTLKKVDNVALVGFGTFEVRKRAARAGRNPSTGEAIKIKASKAPAFKAGAALKVAVNGVRK